MRLKLTDLEVSLQNQKAHVEVSKETGPLSSPLNTPKQMGYQTNLQIRPSCLDFLAVNSNLISNFL